MFTVYCFFSPLAGCKKFLGYFVLLIGCSVVIGVVLFFGSSLLSCIFCCMFLGIFLCRGCIVVCIVVIVSFCSGFVLVCLWCIWLHVCLVLYGMSLLSCFLFWLSGMCFWFVLCFFLVLYVVCFCALLLILFGVSL